MCINSAVETDVKNMTSSPSLVATPVITVLSPFKKIAVMPVLLESGNVLALFNDL